MVCTFAEQGSEYIEREMTGATCKGLVTEEYTSDRVRCKMNEEKKKRNFTNLSKYHLG